MDFHFHLIVTFLLSWALGLDFMRMIIVQLIVDALSIKWLGYFRHIGDVLHLFWIWLAMSLMFWDVSIAMMLHIIMDALAHVESRKYFYPIKTHGFKLLQKLSIFYWLGDPNYHNGVDRHGRS
jgi:hypothetical protein